MPRRILITGASVAGNTLIDVAASPRRVAGVALERDGSLFQQHLGESSCGGSGIQAALTGRLHTGKRL